MAGRVHILSGFLTEKLPVRVVARRDLGAALDILSVLLRLDFGYGEQILDCPPPYVVLDPYNEPTYPMNCDFVGPGDILLQTTRPPLHDIVENNRKQVARSYTEFEEKLFAFWRANYFEHSSRPRILLHNRLHTRLAAPYHTRREMKFRESEGAPYKELNDCTGMGVEKTDEKTEKRTAVFLLRHDEVWPGGPGLVSAFGMDGTATAVWAYRLGRDLSHLLATPGFVVAELVNTGIPQRPTSMQWAAKWDVKILLHEKAN